MTTLTANYTLTSSERRLAAKAGDPTTALKLQPAAGCPLARVWQPNSTAVQELILSDTALAASLPLGSQVQIVITITPPA